MPTSLTLKNIPEALYARLKASAQQHRRSLNNEAIVCLEAVSAPGRTPAAERLAQLRDLRSTLPMGATFAPEDIETFKLQGRP
ncbi:FitA-like ribbon-helix-helix domain-containing protein [Synechococcus sp. EJ6-Ellesmere]|uniref:FitA-like ribbon-helix-helix domain-containing protein n=1 Tax=Synechococcus sp. EJ6-Ellesmere TaxID=2823734 RepID=UPI0020CD1E78|nr:plasmid stability protein [Synechococcus sp. EJ6-Ellesmere]MCP9826114.1 plasmid stability protein [Synechococcus sp. EJ6-Ellesmere]